CETSPTRLRGLLRVAARGVSARARRNVCLDSLADSDLRLVALRIRFASHLDTDVLEPASAMPGLHFRRSPAKESAMNYGRLVIAAIAATVFDAIYGFLVYGQALAGVFSRYPGVYRPADDMSHMPVLMASIFVGALAAAYIYAKGYEGGSGVAEGVRF